MQAISLNKNPLRDSFLGYVLISFEAGDGLLNGDELSHKVWTAFERTPVWKGPPPQTKDYACKYVGCSPIITQQVRPGVMVYQVKLYLGDLFKRGQIRALQRRARLLLEELVAMDLGPTERVHSWLVLETLTASGMRMPV